MGLVNATLLHAMSAEPWYQVCQAPQDAVPSREVIALARTVAALVRRRIDAGFGYESDRLILTGTRWRSVFL